MKKFIKRKEKESITMSNEFFTEFELNQLPFIVIHLKGKSKFCSIEYDVITFFKFRLKANINYSNHISSLYQYYISKNQVLKKDYQYIGGSSSGSIKILTKDAEKIAEFLFDYLLILRDLDISSNTN